MKASCGTSGRRRSASDRCAHASLRALLCACIGWLALGVANADDLKAGVFKPPRAAPDVSLSGSDGSAVTIKRFRGKVVALGFGYTACADVCPTTLALLAEARRQLGAAAKDFQVLYVTVDPERDTAQRLRAYMNAFDPSFIGATGSADVLAGMRAVYGISTTREGSKLDPSAYVIHHSAFVYLIDRAGDLRAIIPFGATADDVAHDVKALLAEHP
jgi:protein SCO1